MKKIKIGIITHNFPISVSDRQNAGIFVLDLAKALNKNADISVLAPGVTDEIKKVAGITTQFFKYESKLGSLKMYNPIHIFKFLIFFIKGEKALNNFLTKNPNLDFIISMWAFPSGFFADKVHKSKKIPYAIYCLGSDIYIYAKKPLLKNLITKYLKNSKFLLADSPDLAAEIQKLTGNRALFLPSASDFRPNPKTKLKSPKIVLSYLGRLEKVKGVDILLNSLKMLGKDLNNFEVNIIGDGSLKPDIKKSISSLKLKDIKFWGNINDPAKISSVLNSSDWLVIPSRSDSIPLVFSESMKLGVPVITSDLPDMNFLVKKYNVGLTFKNGSSADLHKIFKKIITTGKDYGVFKRNTQKVAGIFDLKKISDKLLKLIEENI